VRLAAAMRFGGLAGCLFVCACAGAEAPAATGGDIEALKAVAAAPPRLLPGEKIHVIVYGEDSLTGTYAIDPSGYVTLPLAGTVKAAGLTPEKLQEQLAKQYAEKYLKNPKVTVEVTEFRPFYILGEVDKPGVYPYSGGLNVLNAIAIAGGRTYRARDSYVLIQHVGENDMHKYQLNRSIPILPGDIIQVPRRYF